jgi:hypothetical protein
VRAPLAAALLAALVASPALAWACPACAGRSGQTGVAILLGAMIILPFGVVAAVVRAVRRIERTDGDGLDIE